MPCDLKNTAIPLRGSSFSSMSPFPLLNRLWSPKQLQKEGPGTPGGSPEGSELLPGTPPGAPGASPGGLRSTPSASSEHPVRPKDPPGGPNGTQGAQKTPSGGFRAMVLQDFRSLSSVLEAFRTIKISCLFASKPPSLQASKCLGGMREA